MDFGGQIYTSNPATTPPATTPSAAGYLVGGQSTALELTYIGNGQFLQLIHEGLALFVPLIISSGGNSGSQAATLVIRAMALGEVGVRDWWRVIRREVLSGLALRSILGINMVDVTGLLIYLSVAALILRGTLP